MTAQFDYDGCLAPERAASALGISAARIQILRIVASRAETPTARIITETGMSVNGVRAHLVALERDGLIAPRHTTHPRGAGPITYWRADTDEISELLDDVRSYLLG